MSKSVELRERRAVLAAEAASVLEKNPTRFDALMKEVDDLKGAIERAERSETVDAELRASVRPPLEQINPNGGSDSRSAEQRKAFTKYIRSGDKSELRTYTPMSDSVEGAYIVPQGFQAELEVALKTFGGVREVARTITTSTGNALPWPTVSDVTNTGELVGENSAVGQANPTFGHVTFNAYKYSSKMVQCSLELLQDSAFDVDSYLTRAFADRIGRITNNHFTVGTGSGQPNGINHAATSGPTSGTTLVVSYDDLVELEHSVDPSYRKGSKFMLSDAVLKQIKKLKDSQGHPLWVPGVATNAPDTILGYQYAINQDMPAAVSGGNLMLFGDMSKYVIRAVKEFALVRLNERYAEQGMVAFLGFARYDANLLDAGTHPIKSLVSA